MEETGKEMAKHLKKFMKFGFEINGDPNKMLAYELFLNMMVEKIHYLEGTTDFKLSLEIHNIKAFEDGLDYPFYDSYPIGLDIDDGKLVLFTAMGVKKRMRGNLLK